MQVFRCVFLPEVKKNILLLGHLDYLGTLALHLLCLARALGKDKFYLEEVDSGVAGSLKNKD